MSSLWGLVAIWLLLNLLLAVWKIWSADLSELENTDDL